MEKRRWVILELTANGEREARQGLLGRELVSTGGFRCGDVYVPIIKVGQGEPILLMEGYVFIRTGYPLDKYLSLRETKYIKGLISLYDARTGLISSGTMSDKELKAMIAKTDLLGGKYKVGGEVRIKTGSFEGLKGRIVDILEAKPLSNLEDLIASEGVVKEENLSRYVVVVEMRSVEIILSYDCFSIEGV